jgi:hypothetical protein
VLCYLLINFQLCRFQEWGQLHFRDRINKGSDQMIGKHELEGCNALKHYWTINSMSGPNSWLKCLLWCVLDYVHGSCIHVRYQTPWMFKFLI